MYCDVSNIETYYQNKPFDCDSYVTNKEVQSFILDDGALINAMLKKRYSLPITNTDDLRILKTINACMVVGTVDDITREKDPSGNLERSRKKRENALKLLQSIVDGKLV